MTREEAKDLLDNLIGMIEDNHNSDYDAALRMGIKALEQEPCEDWYDVPSNEMILERARQASKDLRKRFKEDLEQEPCGDLISRQAVLDEISDYNNDLDYTTNELYDRVKRMSPVNPQPKTGHWEQYGKYWEDKFKCSECGKEQPRILCGERIIGHWSDYCPNCGAKMVDEQEI